MGGTGGVGWGWGGYSNTHDAEFDFILLIPGEAFTPSCYWTSPVTTQTRPHSWSCWSLQFFFFICLLTESTNWFVCKFTFHIPPCSEMIMQKRELNVCTLSSHFIQTDLEQTQLYSVLKEIPNILSVSMASGQRELAEQLEMYNGRRMNAIYLTHHSKISTNNQLDCDLLTEAHRL